MRSEEPINRRLSGQDDAFLNEGPKHDSSENLMMIGIVGDDRIEVKPIMS